MRELVVTTFITLDGVMQAPGGPDEDRDGGFQHGGWSVGYWDEMMGALVVDWMQQQDAVLLGRRTYEIFAAHWPRVPDTDPMAARLNGMPKYVASRTLTSVAWNNAHLIHGELADAVMELKRQPGRAIGVPGSCALIQSLLRTGLIDEFRLFVFPVILGTGKRLFGDGTPPQGLDLVESRTSGTGVTIARFRPAASIQRGSFALAGEATRHE
jgi:dihydrofolate reductase